MFSMGNLYLVPTINGEVKYQPKAQAGFFIRNYELEAGKAFVQHSAIFTSILGHNLIEENSHSHQLASLYFIKRSKLTRLCPGSGHYQYRLTKCYRQN